MEKQIVKYDFSCVPTVRAFFLCRKRVKLIMGPFGCVSGDTEFLSPDGWKRIDEYSGEKIAVWKEDGTFAFEYPHRYVVLPCDYMYHFKSGKKVSMMLSPEHRVPLYNFRGKFVVKTAEELAKHPSRHTVPVNFKSITAIGIDKWLLKLGVAVQADGHINGNTCYISLRKKRKIERLRVLLEKCGIKYTEKVYPNRPTEYVFKFWLPEELKNVKSFDGWWHLSQDEAEIVIDEVVHWDGGSYADNDNRYFTTNKKAADFVQFCAHLCGRVATIRKVKYDKPNWNDGYVVYISQPYRSVGFRGDQLEIEKVEVDKKYCFTTSSSFWIARHNDCIFVTGNSGKSSGCVISLLYYMCEQEPDANGVRRTRYAIVRNSVKELKDTTKNTIDDWTIALRPTWKESELKYVFHFQLPDKTVVHSEWLLRALDRPDQVKDLLSLELTGAWLNEAREIPKEVFDTMDGRIGRFPKNCTYPVILMDTNPPDTDHWLYKLFEEQLPNNEDMQEKFAIFKQPSGLSPEAENIPNLPPNYYRNLMIGKDEDFIRVYIHGEYGFVREGRPVFPNFNRDVHVAKEELLPIKGVPLIVGCDFGLYPAAVVCQFTPKGALWVLDEVVSEDATSLEEILDGALLPLLYSRKYYGKEVIVIGDPAGRARSQTDKRNCFMILRSRGLQAYPAYTNSIRARIEAVNTFLTKMVGGEPAFQINPSCKTLIKGLAGKYCFRRLRVSGERYSEIPDKNFWSHICDALTYAALGYSPQFATREINKYSDPFSSTTSGGVLKPRLII